MKYFLALFIVSVIVATSLADLDSDWAAYKVKFNKSYPDPAEDAMRKGIYVETVRRVEEHNKKHRAGEVSWEAGINHFADWTQEELDRSKNKVLSQRQ